MDRSECVHRILPCLPACVREVLWECEASSHRLSINGLLPQKRREDACALQKSRDCGTKHNGRKFAQAAKTFIDTSTDITNSASVIPSKVEESLDIISDTAPALHCVTLRYV
jgi:hypothetical protein